MHDINNAADIVEEVHHARQKSQYKTNFLHSHIENVKWSLYCAL